MTSQEQQEFREHFWHGYEEGQKSSIMEDRTPAARLGWKWGARGDLTEYELFKLSLRIAPVVGMDDILRRDWCRMIQAKAERGWS